MLGGDGRGGARQVCMGQNPARRNGQLGQRGRRCGGRSKASECARRFSAPLIAFVPVTDGYAMDAARAADHDRDRSAGGPLRHVTLRQHRAHEQRRGEEEVNEERNAAGHCAAALGWARKRSKHLPTAFVMLNLLQHPSCRALDGLR